MAKKNKKSDETELVEEVVETKTKKEKKSKGSDLEDILESMGEFAEDLEHYSGAKYPSKSLYSIPFRHKGLQKITNGLKSGYFVLIEGASQSGKSFLLYEIISECEKMGGYSYLTDIERALEENYWDLMGGKPKRLVLSKQNRAEILFPAWTKFIKAVRAKNPTCPIVIGCDSFPLIKSETDQDNFEEVKEDEKKQGFSHMRKNIGIYADIEKFLQVIDDEQVVFVMLNQLRVDYNVTFGDKTTTKGENVLPYLAHMRLRGKNVKSITQTIKSLDKDLKKTEDKKIKVGSVTEWKTLKNRGVKPFQSALTAITYAKGVNPWYGLEALLLEDKSIELASAPKKEKGSNRMKGSLSFKVIGDKSGEIFTKAIDMCEKFPQLLEPIITGSKRDLELQGSEEEILASLSEESEVE